MVSIFILVQLSLNYILRVEGCSQLLFAHTHMNSPQKHCLETIILISRVCLIQTITMNSVDCWPD